MIRSFATKASVFFALFFVTINGVPAQYPTRLNKQILLDMINNARSKGCNCGKTYYPPAPPVKWNDKLEQAAQNHSNNMYSKSFFSHTGKDRSTVSDRVTKTGYAWTMCAENIAMRYKTEKAVIQGWLNNPSHCENMMNKLFTEVGIAIKGPYWTMVLAWPK